MSKNFLKVIDKQSSVTEIFSLDYFLIKDIYFKHSGKCLGQQTTVQKVYDKTVGGFTLEKGSILNFLSNRNKYQFLIMSEDRTYDVVIFYDNNIYSFIVQQELKNNIISQEQQSEKKSWLDSSLKYLNELNSDRNNFHINDDKNYFNL